MTRVELFEAIRRDRLIHGHSVRWIAQTSTTFIAGPVRQALSSALHQSARELSARRRR